MEVGTLETTVKPSWWHPLHRIARSYTVTETDLTIRSGLITRREQTVPRDKVTNVDTALSRLIPGRSSVTVNVGSGEAIPCGNLTRAHARQLAAALNDDSPSSS